MTAQDAFRIFAVATIAVTFVVFVLLPGLDIDRTTREKPVIPELPKIPQEYIDALRARSERPAKKGS